MPVCRQMESTNLIRLSLHAEENKTLHGTLKMKSNLGLERYSLLSFGYSPSLEVKRRKIYP